MLPPVFEKYIFLQSLGWGIANSFWQAALLWMVYQFAVTTNRKLSALFKYHFSLVLLFASFAWFISTVIQNYLAIKNSGTQTAALSWLNISENFTNSLQWLSVAYFLILGVHLLLFAKKLKNLFSLRNSDFSKAPVDIRLFTEQTAFHIGIRRKVNIWLSVKTDVPSVIGFLKPVILLPVSALNNLTTGQAEAVILHELAHIKRNDYLVNFLQCFTEMILFFNPFARLLGNAARKERENCCDDWVLNYQYNKHDYASALLILEQNRNTSISFALAATNGKKNLLARVKRLFADEPSVNFSFLQKVKLLSVSFTILMLVLFALPVAQNETVAGKIQGESTPLLASVVPAGYNETRLPQLIIVNDKPLPARIKKTTPAAAPEEIEYNTALINEELLNQDKELQLQDMAIQVARQETQTVDKIIVKIEEEQSGAKDKCAYYVEVNNNNGTPEIKPLIILNKKVKEIAGKAKAKILSANKKNTVKKRTTT